MSGQEQPSGQDPVRAAVAAHAEACLAALRQTGSDPHPEAAVRERDGWTVLLVAFRTPPHGEVPGLSDCDRDCLTLLAGSREPLSAARVRKELEKRGVGVHGLITVKRSLSRLKRRGLVSNSRYRPRGYHLEDAQPLLDHLARRP
jgi:hypothetical protein